MKCNQLHPGFELVLPCPFPTTTTITPQAPNKKKRLGEMWIVILQNSPYLLNDLHVLFKNESVKMYYKSNPPCHNQWAMSFLIQIRTKIDTNIFSKNVYTNGNKILSEKTISHRYIRKFYSLSNSYINF